MVWCFDRPTPHFYVRDEMSEMKHEIACERWPWTIRFLGDDSVRPSLLETLWYPYEDIVTSLWGPRPGGEVRK